MNLSGYKTFLGIAIAAVPTVAQILGFETSPGFAQDATELVEQLLQIAGLALALYGRLTASSPGWFAKKS